MGKLMDKDEAAFGEIVHFINAVDKMDRHKEVTCQTNLSKIIGIILLFAVRISGL